MPTTGTSLSPLPSPALHTACSDLYFLDVDTTQTPATEALNGCPHPVLKQDCKLQEDGGSRSLLRVIVSSVQSREESTTQRRHLTYICHCFIPLHFLSQ